MIWLVLYDYFWEQNILIQNNFYIHIKISPKMSTLKRIAGVVALILFLGSIAAQNKKYEYIIDRKDSLYQNVRAYCGLLHQHQNFLIRLFLFRALKPV